MVKNIVIVGAGVMGTCTAYFTAISKARGEDVTITLIEATECAAGASGKAGGLLATNSSKHRWHHSRVDSESFRG
jgi:glycine/D-amino acid oxidase-like deaminating enzyme